MCSTVYHSRTDEEREERPRGADRTVERRQDKKHNDIGARWCHAERYAAR